MSHAMREAADVGSAGHILFKSNLALVVPSAFANRQPYNHQAAIPPKFTYPIWYPLQICLKIEDDTL